MSRQYSLFPSARAKARREKFALTRKTLSDQWEHFQGEETIFLASPTIGTHRDLPFSTISPLALITSQQTTSKVNPTTMQSSHVFTQCTILPKSKSPVPDTASKKDEQGNKETLLEMSHLSRSFDWGDLSEWSTPPWEQFHPLVKPQMRTNPTNKVEDEGGGPLVSIVCDKCAQILAAPGTKTVCIEHKGRIMEIKLGAQTSKTIEQQLKMITSELPLVKKTGGLSLPVSHAQTVQEYANLAKSVGNPKVPRPKSTEPHSCNAVETIKRGKASTLPTIEPTKQIVILRNAEKRRRFFAKKQTNSAPDTYYDAHSVSQSALQSTRRLCGNCKEPVTNCLDVVLRATRREKGDTSTITPPSVEVWESEIRTARCGDVAVTHVSELDYPDADPPCHFCCEQASTAIHDESRLQIVSGGLVRSRDGSTRSGSAPYINLPSPNVQAENGQQSFGSLDLSQNLLSPGSVLPCPHSRGHSLGTMSISGTTAPSTRGGSIASTCGGIEEEESLVGPPASSLTRRPALVPRKLIPDPDYDQDMDRERPFGRCSDDMTSLRNRRSSIVVIPPMQICPGDLLVYGKVLSQRKSLLGTPIESPSPISHFFDSENTQRKGKATWSLLKLFERGSRTKGVTSGTLEEIMNLIQPCDFSDPKLSRFKGMVWTDFIAHVANQKTKKSGSVASSGSSSGPSTSSSVTDLKIKCDNHPTDLPLSSTCVPSTSPSSLAISETTTTTKTPIPPSPTKVPLKPLVRKRMGLMRTMSDRCLERRITPALFRGAQGFLMSEKLVEGNESKGSGGGEKPPETPEEEVKETGNKTEDENKVEEETPDPDHRQKLRQKEALWDLFQSECSFLYDHLMVLKNVFMEPMKRIQVEGFAMYAEPELLFGNLDELCAVTYAFCKEFIHLLLTLTNSCGELVTTEVLAKLFEPSSKARAVSQAYHRYALNYINALNYLETLRRHVEFCDFEKLCMKDPRCKKLQLTDLLVSPVQHLMKVPLILKDIQSRTNQPQEKELIAQILEIQEASIRELDDKMRWLKNFERLLEIQRNIIWPSILEMEPKTWVPEFLRVALGRQPCDSIVVSPRRQIIHEGLLQLWDTGKPSECYVILFDDMLLITRRKKGLSKKKSSLTENWQSACGKSSSPSGSETNHRYIVYRQPISLDRFFIHDIGEGESSSAKLDYAFVLVSLNRFQQIIAVHTFQAPADQIKNTWLLKLKTTQDKWKRTLQTTVFRGVRSSTDSGQSNVASSLLGLSGSKGFLHRHNTVESSN